MSLDPVDLILSLERDFKITLPEPDLSAVRTVGHLTDLIMRKQQGVTGVRPDRLAILGRVRRAVAEHCGERPESIYEASLFVEDLGY